jgi:hypothetical protein
MQRVVFFLHLGCLKIRVCFCHKKTVSDRFVQKTPYYCKGFRKYTIHKDSKGWKIKYTVKLNKNQPDAHRF